MTTKNLSKTNVIDFAAAKAANKIAGSDLGEALRALATEADAGKVRNIFLAWTMTDNSLHFGHASLESAVALWEDDHLRLLGLLRIAERGFEDALVLPVEEAECS